MSQKTKWLIISFAIIGILFIGYRILSQYLLGELFKKKYSMEDAIENYYKKEQKFINLVTYFRSVLPDVKLNKGVLFGLCKSKNHFEIGISLLDGSVDRRMPNHGGDNLKLNSPQTDSLLKELNWTPEVVNHLKEKMQKTNCMNIFTLDENTIRLDFKYSGLGLFSYLIFNSPLSASKVAMYNEELRGTVLRNNVVVIYTSAP